MKLRVVKISRPKHKLKRNTRWIMSAKPGHRFERVVRDKLRS